MRETATGTISLSIGKSKLDIENSAVERGYHNHWLVQESSGRKRSLLYGCSEDV